MGRKIEMKKIQDNTKCQVTFSKRRTSLIKKAEEISFSCDVDVLFLAFSPSGRISKFCNRERMEDLLDRYVNLPVEKRLSNIKNVQGKMEKLRSLGNIRDEEGKLYYINDQVENLQLQIKNHQLEVQLAEANLRDFELNPEQEASLHQLSWCERNLQQSIEKIKEIKKEKMVTENEAAMAPLLYNSRGNNVRFAGSSSSNGQPEMQFESWRNNQYVYPENIFNEMLGKGKGKEVAYACEAPETTMQNNTFYASTPTSYGMHQLGVPENRAGTSCSLWQINTCNSQLPSSYGMNQPRIALAGKTPDELIYAPSQVDPNHGYPQQYASNMHDYESWKQALMPWQQPESRSSFRNFGGESSNFTQNHQSGYLSAFPESNSNHVTARSADASNYWDMPPLQNQPNMVLNNMDIDVNEESNEDAYNEMIVSPSPSVGAPISTSGDSNDLYDFFP